MKLKVRADSGNQTNNQLVYFILPLLLTAISIIPLRGDFVITDNGYFPASLLSPGSARSSALGFSYVSFANESSAVAWNPAGLAMMEGFEAGIHHDSSMENSFRETVSAGIRVKGAGGFGATVSFSDSGLFERRDESGLLLEGMNSASEFGAAAGWGVELPAGLSGGLSLQYAGKNIASERLNIFGASAGLNAELGDSLRFSSVFSAAAFEGLPVSLMARAGFLFEADMDDNNKFSAAVTGEFDSSLLSRVNAAAEAYLFSSLFLRAGYTHDVRSPSSGNQGIITAGAGVRIEDFLVDYAYVPFGDAGTSHRVSLTFAPKLKHEPMPDSEKRVFLPRSDKRVISFEAVRFGHNKYKLTAGMKELTKKNIEILKNNPDTEVRIAGHTSMSGTHEYNKRLSELRAMSIRNYLIREGDIPADRIFIIGYGDSMPAVLEEDPLDTDSDSAKNNRRGMFEIVKVR